MNELIIVADYTEDATLTVAEICEICGIEMVVLQDLVAYEVVVPQRGFKAEQWQFDMAQLKRLRIALRLQRDLELNAAALALVLQLLEERENLRAQSVSLHKHLIK